MGGLRGCSGEVLVWRVTARQVWRLQAKALEIRWVKRESKINWFKLVISEDCHCNYYSEDIREAFCCSMHERSSMAGPDRLLESINYLDTLPVQPMEHLSIECFSPNTP